MVIRQARWKAGLLAAGGVAFALMGVAMIREGGRDGWAGWLCLAFFGACGLLGAGQLVRPGRLVLSPAGLGMEMLWRRRRWAWSDIDGFDVLHNEGARLVVFHDRGARISLLNRVMPETRLMSGSLPPNWRVKPEALVVLLTQAKARWG